MIFLMAVLVWSMGSILLFSFTSSKKHTENKMSTAAFLALYLPFPKLSTTLYSPCPFLYTHRRGEVDDRRIVKGKEKIMCFKMQGLRERKKRRKRRCRVKCVLVEFKRNFLPEHRQITGSRVDIEITCSMYRSNNKKSNNTPK